MSSSLLPLYDFCGNYALDDGELLGQLRTLGQAFKDSGIRVTTHPGQFTVLSSDKSSVVENSIKELEYHAWIFDQMGFDQTTYYAINIHGGKSGRIEQLIDVIKSLSPSVKNRLTLENDEKCYSVKDLNAAVSACNVPIVFDSHHHVFNDGGLNLASAYSMAIDSWNGVKPLQHISNSEIGTETAAFNQKRAHSKMIHKVNSVQLYAMRNNLIDVDVEAKNKNIAVLDMREKFSIEV
jgi:UV DNA damage endonuclease